MVECDQHELASRAQLPFAREHLLRKRLYLNLHGGLSYRDLSGALAKTNRYYCSGLTSMGRHRETDGNSDP